MRLSNLSGCSTVLILLSISWVGGQNSPSEFLQSYLSRPHLLATTERTELPARSALEEQTVTLIVSMDNWSVYKLLYRAHAVEHGHLDGALPPRDLAPKSRDVALRMASTPAGGGRTTGMVGWALSSPEGERISRISVAWDVDGEPAEHRTKFSLAFGQFIPTQEEMWKNRANEKLYSTVGRELNKAVVLADLHVTVAVNMTKNLLFNEYQLTISIVPQHVDVWGWVKYFQDEAPGTNPTHSSLPQVTHRGDKVSTSLGSESTSKRDHPESGATSALPESHAKPLYEQKNLLQLGSEYYRIQAQGHSFRDSLRESASERSAAVGLHVENWSRFLMGKPSVEIQSGSPVIQPQAIEPGKQEVAIVGNEGFMTGTNGVIRWNLGSSQMVLSLMWSVPHTRQFWGTWVAVGLTSEEQTPSFDLMYNGVDETRFVRHEGGREFEFSDGKNFIVLVRMDGGSTFKPVLHVGLIPIVETDLAGSVRRKLGLPVVEKDDLTELMEPPQFGLRQSANGAYLSTPGLTMAILMNILTQQKRFGSL